MQSLRELYNLRLKAHASFFLHSLAQGFRPRTRFTRTGYTLTPRRAARLRSCTSLQDIHAINLAVYWVFAWVLVTSCTSKQNVYAVMLVCMPGREGPPCRAYEGPTCPCTKKCRGPCHEQKTFVRDAQIFWAPILQVKTIKQTQTSSGKATVASWAH